MDLHKLSLHWRCIKRYKRGAPGAPNDVWREVDEAKDHPRQRKHQKHDARNHFGAGVLAQLRNLQKHVTRIMNREHNWAYPSKPVSQLRKSALIKVAL